MASSVDKLSIGYEMTRFDLKDRAFYDDLTDEERKKFSPYLMIRWGSCVEGPVELQAYYLISVNEKLNRNFFDISTRDHKKMQWLLASTVSPGMGKQRHNWISAKKRENNNKAEKFLKTLFPELKPYDITLLAQLNDKESLKDMARKHGWDDKRIRDEF